VAITEISTEVVTKLDGFVDIKMLEEISGWSEGNPTIFSPKKGSSILPL